MSDDNDLNTAPTETNKPIGRLSRVRHKVRFNKKFIKTVLAILVVGALFFFGYQYIHTRNELNKAKNPEQAAKDETQKILDEVGVYLELPQGEQPSTATVSNKERLKAQPFFEHAENGDKVLIFAKARQAILYRPSTKKVIEYAPVSPDAAPAQAEQPAKKQ